MIILLDQLAAGNWLIIAEGLNDPEAWNRFVPCHSVDSDRYKFDAAVKQLAGDLKLSLCKELLRSGKSVFKYDWQADENDILDHAMAIAQLMEVDLYIHSLDAA